MKFQDLAKKIVEGKVTKVSNWPSSLYFGSETKSLFEQIRSYSMEARNYLFLGESGSTTYEYAFTAVYIVDKMYYSKPIKGDYTSVLPLPRIAIQPKRIDDGYRLEITLGEKVKTSRKYNTNELGQKINWGVVLSAHTHPRIYTSRTYYYHTWFSQQDFIFLLKTQAPIVALLRDSDVWLACQTDLSIMPSAQIIQQMTLLEQEHKNEEMKKYLKAHNDTNIVFYNGKIKGRLERV